VIVINLPWPPEALSPNSRKHWRRKAEAAAKYRGDCCYASQAAGARCLDWGGAKIGLTFQPPVKRDRDADNLIAQIKSGLDGIADATGINDRDFRLGAPVIAEPVRGGNVIVEISKP